MNDETAGPGPGSQPSYDPAAVPDRWAPPGAAPADPGPSHPTRSSLAPPPAPPASVSVSTGPVGPDDPPRRWPVRIAALGVAAALVGGGGFLALGAGTADGGADSPAGALTGALDALSDEDLLTAAAFVEPTERDTMIDAGFEVVEELVRLEVFSDDLDLGSVPGIDLAFTDVEVDTVDVAPGLAHLFLRGGTATSSLSGADAPLGALVTDRVDPETLAVTETDTDTIEPSDVPIVAVERGGRWYLSLWYTAAENGRLAAGLPLPDAADRPAAIGGDTPEGAVADLVAATTRLDLASMVGMLDPEEMAALYDYAPLFLSDGQAVIDDALAAIRDEGWQWDVTTLDLRSEESGDLATVYVDAVGFEATGPDGGLTIDVGGDGMAMHFDDGRVRVDVAMVDGCTVTEFEDEYGSEREEFCADDVVEAMGGLDLFSTGVFATDSTGEPAGLVVRRVDGRWYLSPLRTGSTAMLGALRALGPEDLAETVDGVVELFNDPSMLFGAAFGASGLGDALFTEDPLFDDDPFEDPLFDDEALFDDDGGLEVPGPADEHIGLLAPALDVVSAYDLTGRWRDDAWYWLDAGRTVPEFGAGAAGGLVDDGGHWIDVIVLRDVGFDDAALGQWLGVPMSLTDDGIGYVTYESSWGATALVSRTEGGGLVVVTSFDADPTSLLDVLRVQLGAD